MVEVDDDRYYNRYFILVDGARQEVWFEEYQEWQAKLDAERQLYDWSRLPMTVVCDFCNWSVVDWVYPVTPGTDAWLLHEVERPSGIVEAYINKDISQSSWKLCDTCHLLVQGDAWESLYDRTRYQLSIRHPNLTFDDTTCSAIRNMIECFRNVKHGSYYAFG